MRLRIRKHLLKVSTLRCSTRFVVDVLADNLPLLLRTILAERKHLILRILPSVLCAYTRIQRDSLYSRAIALHGC